MVGGIQSRFQKVPGARIDGSVGSGVGWRSVAAGGQDELGSKDTRGMGIMWLHTAVRNAKKITSCVIWSARVKRDPE